MGLEGTPKTIDVCTNKDEWNSAAVQRAERAH